MFPARRDIHTVLSSAPPVPICPDHSTCPDKHHHLSVIGKDLGAAKRHLVNDRFPPAGRVSLIHHIVQGVALRTDSDHRSFPLSRGHRIDDVRFLLKQDPQQGEDAKGPDDNRNQQNLEAIGHRKRIIFPAVRRDKRAECIDHQMDEKSLTNAHAYDSNGSISTDHRRL